MTWTPQKSAEPHRWEEEKRSGRSYENHIWYSPAGSMHKMERLTSTSWKLEPLFSVPAIPTEVMVEWRGEQWLHGVLNDVAWAQGDAHLAISTDVYLYEPSYGLSGMFILPELNPNYAIDVVFVTTAPRVLQASLDRPKDEDVYASIDLSEKSALRGTGIYEAVWTPAKVTAPWTFPLSSDGRGKAIHMLVRQFDAHEWRDLRSWIDQEAGRVQRVGAKSLPEGEPKTAHSDSSHPKT